MLRPGVIDTNDACGKNNSVMFIGTTTADNGHEFDHYRQLEQDFGLAFYFADPHAPWQRGSNEQTHGLVRHFLPKSTDFNHVRDAKLAKIESMLNNCPR